MYCTKNRIVSGSTASREIATGRSEHRGLEQTANSNPGADRTIQGRLQASPVVEQQLKEITRSYQTAQDFYNELLEEAPTIGRWRPNWNTSKKASNFASWILRAP